MPDIKVRVGQQNTVKVLASAYGGALTAETATNVVGGIASVTQLSNTGVSTLGGPVLAGSDLRVAGVSTFVGVSTFGGDVYIEGDLYLKDDITLDDISADSINISGLSTFVGVSTFGGDVYIGGDLHLKDDIVLDEISARSLTVSGVSTLGVTSTTLLESQELNVTGITTFSNSDVVFQGAAAGQNMTWDASENDLEFSDDARLKFGNSDDLEIWHSGNSAIKNSTGDFKLRSDSLMLKRADDSEAYLKAEVNKSVEIYYGMGGGSAEKKFETTKEGVLVSGGTTTGSLSVTGVSTFVGVSTFGGDVYIGGDLYLGDDLVLDNITGNSLKITGLSTFVGNAQFDGIVSIGGTLTYEDVTNVDSVGIVTAGKGLRATTGGLVVTAGVSTFGADATVAGTLTAGLIDGGSY